MIRVAFPLNFRDKSWMGGVNYFRNLFEALRLSSSPVVEPVIFSGPSADREILASFGVAEIHISRWGGSSGWRWKLRRASTLGLGRDFVYERELRAQGIALFSHMGYLGARSRIPSLVWIPDFQERYLPEFFSPVELAARERSSRQTVQHASAILLSSEHARDGLAEISPAAAQRAYVLSFVATVPALSEIPPRAELESRYGFLGDYFFLPNQFWAHKNHEIVIRALELLRRNGSPVTVIATGNPNDHRQPEHGQRLLRMVAEAKVAEDFRVLGIVPYRDLMGLMAHAVGVLNPSLFEGWSTTVEEAKSMGKLAVISDIPVHREQAPARAAFFDPRDPAALFAVMLEVLGKHSPDQELACMRQAEAALPARRAAFAHRYEEIAVAVGGGGQ